LLEGFTQANPRVASQISDYKPERVNLRIEDLVPMKLMGIDSFAPTGSASYLLEHFGLTADAIAAQARELLKNGR
jgi:transketolase